MNGTNLFKIALRALANNKLRAFLTMLGIIIGVASVITMLASDKVRRGVFKVR
jgi:putative ABC transport system permease protein